LRKLILFKDIKGGLTVKITTEKLKELIKEELDNISSSDARKMSRQQSLDVAGSEITPIERSAIVQLQKALLDAAKKTNIATGKVGALMKRLAAELANISPAAPKEQPKEV